MSRYGSHRAGPPSQFTLASRRRRAALATLVVLAVILFLGAAYFRTQVIRNDDFVLRSDDNRMRVIPIPAPRGAIFDRNGALIAETLTSYALHLQPTPADSVRPALERLQSVLGWSEEDLERLLGQVRSRPHEPLLLSRALSFEQVSWIEENRTDLPDLMLEAYPQRHYPEGAAIAHLVGYVAEISRSELDDSVNFAGYTRGQIVGKSGVERQYEQVLGGQLGERYVEVDARGRLVGALAPREARPPVAGEAIRLTIDLELQRYIHSIFPKDHNGAVVAMVPSTGEILALYSSPTYDPNRLIGGVDDALWRQLNTDTRRPLLNRAIAGIYPPGSTWKLATAIVGLESGVIEAETRMPIGCSGGMSYAGRYSRCWRAEGHGILDLAGAIANSCNVYFYQLGIWLGLNRLSREGTRLGFSRRTGVDLPGESAGTFPQDAEWYRNRFGWTPTPSEVMSLSIGQGPNAQTPVRMAQFFSALAGNGTAPAPRLRQEFRAPMEIETDLGLKPQTLESLREGMARVLQPGGTAYMASLKRWQVYGKTGTAQNTQDPSKPHAWFTGFAGAPDGPPEIAFAVILEYGESGSGAAAPIGSKLADFYLNSKYGLPTEHLQTLGERSTGRAIGDPAR